MITPTKGISPQRAILSVSAQIAEALDEPMTVTGAWVSLLNWRKKNGAREPISFSWFSYALDVLYACGFLYYEDGLLHKIGKN